MEKNAAFLWDESFLWGLMAYKALRVNGLSFELIRSEDIKNGGLKDYTMLFVPGGWASNKLRSLGDDGAQEIKRFVRDGGNYLGFCGGAGLATLDCIGLLNVKRKPTRERVPSFSGRIYLNTDEHPIWEGQNPEHRAQNKEQRTKNKENNKGSLESLGSGFCALSSNIFHAWWPSQFLIENNNIKILAAYGEALTDSFSSDLNVGDVETDHNWSELEDIYQINLNPKRLLNDPAVIEGSFGKGRVILSLIHFDTPDDLNGAVVLRNLWKNLSTSQPLSLSTPQFSTSQPLNLSTSQLPIFIAISELYALCSELISIGIRNFLWFWRNPMLLQWRRGVRGLEYCTLYAMIKELREIIGQQSVENRLSSLEPILTKIRELLMPFVDNARQLLILERHALRNGHITYERCDNPEITKIRTELFSNSKSHGGLFKKLIQEIDYLLYDLLKKQENEKLGS